jgi:hypothetical protein
MKKILITILFLLGFIVIAIFVLFKTKEVTNINVKTIPQSASSYIIIDPQAVSNDIKNHYRKHPGQLLQLMDGLMDIKEQSIPFQIDINEPFSIYFDSTINAICCNLSINHPEDIIPWVSSYYEVDIDTTIDNIKLHLLNNRHLIINTNKKKDQARIFYLINPKPASLSLISKILSFSPSNDTIPQNKEAYEMFSKQKAALSYNYKINHNNKIRPFLNSVSGSIEMLGTKSIFNCHVTFEKNIFNNLSTKNISQSMGDLVYFKANFNNQLIQLLNIIGIAPFPFYKKHCNGELIISINNFKNLNTIPNNNVGDILNCMDFRVSFGIDSIVDTTIFNNDLNRLKNKVHSYLKLEDSLTIDYLEAERKLILKASEEQELVEEQASSPLNLRIDFEKIIQLESQDLFFNLIKPNLKRINLKALQLETIEISNHEIDLKGELSVIDTSRHILISPFVNN